MASQLKQQLSVFALPRLRRLYLNVLGLDAKGTTPPLHKYRGAITDPTTGDVSVGFAPTRRRTADQRCEGRAGIRRKGGDDGYLSPWQRGPERGG